jgi:diguanylate cyclase (GGDEF)-like protein
MIDIFLKKINDNYGHRTGDVAIERVSNTIKTSITDIDIAGRYGGEEFMVFIGDTNYDSVLSISKRIINNVRKLIIVNENHKLSCICICSIGVFYMKDIKYDISLEQVIELSD